MKILLAADGSDYTIKAIRYLTAHFNWFREPPELHLLHVKAPIPDGRVKSMLGHDALEEYYRDEAQQALAPARQLLDENKVPFRSEYVVGDVAEQIKAYVTQNGMDMIVMGSHGHGALQSLFMGSTTTKVLGAATVPVLVIR